MSTECCTSEGFLTSHLLDDRLLLFCRCLSVHGRVGRKHRARVGKADFWASWGLRDVEQRYSTKFTPFSPTIARRSFSIVLSLREAAGGTGTAQPCLSTSTYSGVSRTWCGSPRGDGSTLSKSWTRCVRSHHAEDWGGARLAVDARDELVCAPWVAVDATSGTQSAVVEMSCVHGFPVFRAGGAVAVVPGSKGGVRFSSIYRCAQRAQAVG